MASNVARTAFSVVEPTQWRRLFLPVSIKLVRHALTLVAIVSSISTFRSVSGNYFSIFLCFKWCRGSVTTATVVEAEVAREAVRGVFGPFFFTFTAEDAPFRAFSRRGW